MSNNKMREALEAVYECAKDGVLAIRESAFEKVVEALAEPLRNDVDGSKIKSESDFEKAFNLRKVRQCCSMCRYGDDEVGCTCTCSHPCRNDNGNYCDPDMPRIIISNTMQNYVCDLFV